MLKFFRKIRQRLLKEGRLSTYLLYAIGEIFLVVIGILIALQINNWNEARKAAANEAYLLNEILLNLKEDKEQLAYILERRKETEVAVQNLLNHFDSAAESTPVKEKDVSRFLAFERYYPMYNAFEMMKSTGLKTQNQKLGTAISRYYDFEQKKIAQSIYDIERVFMRLVHSNNAIRANIQSMNVGTNEDSTISLYNPGDPTFKKILKEELVSFVNNNSTTVARITDFLKINQHLIWDLTEELKNSSQSKN